MADAFINVKGQIEIENMLKLLPDKLFMLLQEVLQFKHYQSLGITKMLWLQDKQDSQSYQVGLYKKQWT